MLSALFSTSLPVKLRPSAEARDDARRDAYLHIPLLLPTGVFCHSHVAIKYALARFPEWFPDGRASVSIPRPYTLWP